MNLKRRSRGVRWLHYREAQSFNSSRYHSLSLDHPPFQLRSANVNLQLHRQLSSGNKVSACFSYSLWCKSLPRCYLQTFVFPLTAATEQTLTRRVAETAPTPTSCKSIARSCLADKLLREARTNWDLQETLNSHNSFFIVDSNTKIDFTWFDTVWCYKKYENQILGKHPGERYFIGWRRGYWRNETDFPPG
jgi:hypothetical protein